MTTSNLSFGIPNMEIASASGLTVNPSSFAGHRLVALFCPLEEESAAREIAAYTSHSADFLDLDVWLLTFADHYSMQGRRGLLTIPDTDRRAWVAFRNLTSHSEEMDRSSGAVFMFNRGGALHHYWHGAGHVDDVLADLWAPPFQHHHQLAG